MKHEMFQVKHVPPALIRFRVKILKQFPLAAIRSSVPNIL
jgi:hypothetical protein